MEYKITHSPLILGPEIKVTWCLILPKHIGFLCPGAVSRSLTDEGKFLPERDQMPTGTSSLLSFSTFVWRMENS